MGSQVEMDEEKSRRVIFGIAGYFGRRATRAAEWDRQIIITGNGPLTRGEREKAVDQERARRGMPKLVRVVFVSRNGKSSIMREATDGRVISRYGKRRSAQLFS